MIILTIDFSLHKKVQQDDPKKSCQLSFPLKIPDI